MQNQRDKCQLNRTINYGIIIVIIIIIIIIIITIKEVFEKLEQLEFKKSDVIGEALCALIGIHIIVIIMIIMIVNLILNEDAFCALIIIIGI